MLRKYHVLSLPLLFLTACTDQIVETTTQSGSPDQFLVSYSPSQRVDAEQVAEVVRSALEDREIRTLLMEKLDAAPEPEHKIFLDDILAEPTNRLRAALGQSASRSSIDLTNLLRRLPPLEVYFPVDAHRQRWHGEPDLVVAVQISEQLPPRGTTLSGEPYPLSLDAPPAVPVLMIVPAESRQSSRYTMANSITPDGDIYPAGVYLRSLTLDDDGEAWPRGDPEIEVDLVGPHSAQYPHRAKIWSCAHEGAPTGSHRRFDMNNSYWPGTADAKVLIADSQSMADLDTVYASAGVDTASLMFHIWEDDTDRCEIVADASEYSVLQNTVGGGLLVYGAVAFTADCIDPEEGDEYDCLYAAMFAAAAYEVTPNVFADLTDSNDEFLGLMAAPDNWSPSDSARSHPVRAKVMEQSSVVGSAEIAYMPGIPIVVIEGDKNPTRPGPYEPPKNYRYDAETDFTLGDIEYSWEIRYGSGPLTAIGTGPSVTITIDHDTPSFSLWVDIVNRNMLETSAIQVNVSDPACDPGEVIC